MTSASAQTSAEPARGLTNPTLALNLSRVRDFYPGLQFLDLARMMRPWRAVKHGQPHSAGLSNEELQQLGHLDANGWPIRLPKGQDALWTVMTWNDLPQDSPLARGRYILRYEGVGTVKLHRDAHVVSQQPGLIIFDNRKGKTFTIEITRTDPLRNGDYVRNISIVAERHLELHAAGATFNPDWLRLIQDARQVRFMDWGETNNSKIVNWEDRSTPQSANNFRVPLEHMVQLANEIGAEPWFTMPHMASETYIRNFATYVRDHMDPTLPIRVEYSNEVWNWRFEQAHWVLQQSIKDWGEERQPAYHTKKAVETALIWNEVFGEMADMRLVHVLGAQAINTWRTRIAMKAEAWRENEPDAFVAPESVFDELAIAHYFGGTLMRNEQEQIHLLNTIKSPEINAIKYLAERLRDPSYSHSLPDLQSRWREHAELAKTYGLKLTAYEGGQHVHHHSRTPNLSDEDRALLEEFMVEFVRSEEMAELYRESWYIWSEISDGPFMQFGDMTTPTKWGSWGIYEGLNITTKRGNLINALNAEQDPWWESAKPNASFQHGVTKHASAQADTLTGTDQEDYILAGDGDDRIVESAGDDGVHGGNGMDTVLLSDVSGAYRIEPKGGGYKVSGPQGRDFYVSVERVIFGTGEPIILADLPVGADGALILPEQDAQLEIPPNFVVPEVRGGVVDAADYAGVLVPVGGTVSAINRWSALGIELGLNARSGTKPAYFISEAGAEAIVGDQVITPKYHVVNENRLSPGSPPLTDSAITTARLLGSIALNVSAIVGSPQDDRFFGRGSGEAFCGGEGNDYIATAAGDDIVEGGDGKDSLITGSGDDTLDGGKGNDRLRGEGGKDNYLFNAGCGHDTVQGFTLDDKVVLSNFINDDQTVDEIATDTESGLLLVHGTDSILFEGLSRADLSWMTILRD
ncbi:calcium-binding protein [Tateyamaria sp. ANG-S1]|uniref:calcium-binding protein n=1 Tax=Tateyamaria sp. ANG-S1 TaxID=1577905 RepID=UPI00187BFB0E|nr:calcium-binding protein [Tateyamaria sp. ANG-S1]